MHKTVAEGLECLLLMKFEETRDGRIRESNSAENRDSNLNRLIGLFNERSSILDRSLSHSKHVTMNLGRDYKSGTQPQLTCPTYLRH